MASILIVGAGFAGATSARVLAEAGHRIRLIDRRAHVGGNAHDDFDAYGLLVHTYGPHIFHTSQQHVVDFLSRFTDWFPYEHRVLARAGETLYPIPINRDTLSRFFDITLPDEAAAKALLDNEREVRDPILTSEDVVLSAVGPRLYTAFFQGYTRKQWGLDPAQLDASVCARIPTRLNTDDRYFTDPFQAIPAQGYTSLFTHMLDHSNIDVNLHTVFDDSMRHGYNHIVWTDTIDSFYSCCYGPLPYRGLRFEHIHLHSIDHFQAVGSVNEPDVAVPYTRTTEFKHITGQHCAGTSLLREYPTNTEQAKPAYPIPRSENKLRYQKYATLAATDPLVTFVGRLDQYRYLNMDATVAAALEAAIKVQESLLAKNVIP